MAVDSSAYPCFVWHDSDRVLKSQGTKPWEMDPQNIWSSSSDNKWKLVNGGQYETWWKWNFHRFTVDFWEKNVKCLWQQLGTSCVCDVTVSMSVSVRDMSYGKFLSWSLGHAKQLLFWCLGWKVAVYSWKRQRFFLDLIVIRSTDIRVHRAGSQLKNLACANKGNSYGGLPLVGSRSTRREVACPSPGPSRHTSLFF